eukprot:scaffold17166_cov113-Cylindrotheca_fusiformis.AAC.2
MQFGNNTSKRLRLKEVDPELFVYTSETKDTDIPKWTVTHLRVDSSVTEIPERSFFNCCKVLLHVELPETLKRIKAFSFSGCLSLKSVQFISKGALEDSSINPHLEEDGLIVVPETAKLLQIDEEAFSNCLSLRKVIFCSASTKLGEGVFFGCYGLFSVELPEGLQVIERNLFCFCEWLTKVKMPSSVIKIGDRAFYLCRRLTSFDLLYGLEVSDSMVTLHIPSTVSSIGTAAFQECNDLQCIKLPPTFQRIENGLCNGCKRLIFIEIPATVTIIDDYAFHRCLSLSSIRIPPSVDSIGREAFSHCSNLISIELPKGFPCEIDLSGCFSLVNVAGPILRKREMEYAADFMQGSKLGSAVDDEADLDFKLKHRFDTSPLNELCYYQSYQSAEGAMLQLRRMLKDDPLTATTQVDEFGMTPLHILSLSQTPNLDMLLTLMKGGQPDHIFHCRDSFGSSPMDYLCLNRMPNTTHVIRTVVQAHIDRLGLDPSFKSDMILAVEEALAVDWSSRRREIGRVFFKLANYERMKHLSLMELCLWKMKIDEAGSLEQMADRESCRINNGASVVIPHVLTFLDKLHEEDYVVSNP